EPLAPHVMRQRTPLLCFFACRRRRFRPTAAFAPTAEARVNTPAQRTAPPPPFFCPLPPPILPTAAHRVTHNSSAPSRFRARCRRFFARRRRRFRPTAAIAPTADARVNTPTQRTVLHTIPAPPAVFEHAAAVFCTPPPPISPHRGFRAHRWPPKHTATGFGPAAAAAVFFPATAAAFTPRGVHAHWQCGRPSAFYTQCTLIHMVYLCT
ncbi:hypothetical protein B0H11DRAFT_2115039, partial [Mycena galericulata]